MHRGDLRKGYRERVHCHGGGRHDDCSRHFGGDDRRGTLDFVVLARPGYVLRLQGRASTCTEDGRWLILVIYVEGAWLVKLAIRQGSSPVFGSKASVFLGEGERRLVIKMEMC